jgi:hypothetical protein
VGSGAAWWELSRPAHASWDPVGLFSRGKAEAARVMGRSGTDDRARAGRWCAVTTSSNCSWCVARGQNPAHLSPLLRPLVRRTPYGGGKTHARFRRLCLSSPCPTRRAQHHSMTLPSKGPEGGRQQRGCCCSPPHTSARVTIMSDGRESPSRRTRTTHGWAPPVAGCSTDVWVLAGRVADRRQRRGQVLSAVAICGALMRGSGLRRAHGLLDAQGLRCSSRRLGGGCPGRVHGLH